MKTDSMREARRRVVVAGIVGNVMEWYDFAVYGYFARTIGKLFFPSDDPTATLLAAFGAFAVGFLMRPLGAVVFGYVGDRVGRGPALLWSVVAMAVPTFVMGVLPTYETIGIAAPILMILCRAAQGLAVGGEFTGSAVFLAETALPGRRGQAGAWAPFGAVGGILLGSTAGAVVLNALPLDDVVSWGWRVPFLFGVAVGAVGFILRRRLSIDVPAATSGFPLAVAVRRHHVSIVQALGISLTNAVPFYIALVYIVTWLRLYADVKASQALTINSINIGLMLLVIPASAWLSDRIGRRPVLVAASGGLVLLSWPLLALMQGGQLWAVSLGQLGFAVLIGCYGAVSPVAICELFPRGVRCSAVSAAYNLTVGIAGGTAPMVATWLIAWSGYPLSPALYMALATALSLAAALSIRESLASASTAPVDAAAMVELGRGPGG